MVYAVAPGAHVASTRATSMHAWLPVCCPDSRTASTHLTHIGTFTLTPFRTFGSVIALSLILVCPASEAADRLQIGTLDSVPSLTPSCAQPPLAKASRNAMGSGQSSTRPNTANTTDVPPPAYTNTECPHCAADDKSQIVTGSRNPSITWSCNICGRRWIQKTSPQYEEWQYRHGLYLSRERSSLLK